MGCLDDVVAIVASTNSGVGDAIAKLFAAEGTRVVMTPRRKAAFREVSDEMDAAGGATLLCSPASRCPRISSV